MTAQGSPVFADKHTVRSRAHTGTAPPPQAVKWSHAFERCSWFPCFPLPALNRHFPVLSSEKALPPWCCGCSAFVAFSWCVPGDPPPPPSQWQTRTWFISFLYFVMPFPWLLDGFVVLLFCYVLAASCVLLWWNLLVTSPPQTNPPSKGQLPDITNQGTSTKLQVQRKHPGVNSGDGGVGAEGWIPMAEQADNTTAGKTCNWSESWSLSAYSVRTCWLWPQRGSPAMAYSTSKPS